MAGTLQKMFLKCPQDKLGGSKWLGANTAPLLEGNAKCEPLQKRETVQADLLGTTVQVPRSPAPSAPSPMQTNGEHFTRETMEATRGSRVQPEAQDARSSQTQIPQSQEEGSVT